MTAVELDVWTHAAELEVSWEQATWTCPYQDSKGPFLHASNV